MLVHFNLKQGTNLFLSQAQVSLSLVKRLLKESTLEDPGGSFPGPQNASTGRYSERSISKM